MKLRKYKWSSLRSCEKWCLGIW